MKKFEKICLAFMLMGCGMSVMAQEETRTRELPLSFSVTQLQAYQFAPYVSEGLGVYNGRGTALAEVLNKENVKTFKINPSGSTIALLLNKKGITTLKIYDLWKKNTQLFEFKKINPVTMAFTADAKQLLVVDGNGVMTRYATTAKYPPIGEVELPFVPTDMIVSDNNYFLALIDDTRVAIMNLETGAIRKTFDVGSEVTGVDFSTGSDRVAILTADGLLSIYDTRNFLIQKSYDAMGNALSCAFHPDGKYIAVVTGDSRITLVNLLEDTDRRYVDSRKGGVSFIKFLTNARREHLYLLYNSEIGLTMLENLVISPNYQKLLSTELNEKMEEWMKMLPDETLEAYRVRVNEQTRAAQLQLFSNEISTRLADNLIGLAEVSLGNYNPSTNMLEVDFSNMPSILLNVPELEVTTMKAENLQFNDNVYGLTSDDHFELIYSNVLDKASGKSYEFNNLDRKQLDFLSNNEDYVPLEVIQQASLEEQKLTELKEQVLAEAMENNTLTDHTHINVSSKVIQDVDADGKKILNYEVGVTYQVDGEFSARDDFAPGKFKTTESAAAMSMLAIAKSALEGDFSQYVKAGKKLEIRVKGMADGLPITGKIAYDGIYGEFDNEPVYKNDDLSSISLTKAGGITQNEQLAFVRAYGVRDYLQKNVPSLADMKTTFKNYIEVVEGKGGEFRRISVYFTFVDAF